MGSDLREQGRKGRTQNSSDQKRIAESTLLEEETGISVQERETGQLLSTSWQGGAERAARVGALATFDVGADELLEAVVADAVLVELAAFFKEGVFNDSVFAIHWCGVE